MLIVDPRRSRTPRKRTITSDQLLRVRYTAYSGIGIERNYINTSLHTTFVDPCTTAAYTYLAM